MKAAIFVAGLLSAGLILAASTGAAQQAGRGGGAAIDAEALFAARCKSCHEPPVQRAPSRDLKVAGDAAIERVW